MSDGESQPDSDLEGRLSGVDRRVRTAMDRRLAQQSADVARRRQARQARASGAAWRIMIDLIAATGVGGVMGYGIDRLTGLSPLGLLAGLFFGFGTGMWMAVRLAQRVQAAQTESGDESGPN